MRQVIGDQAALPPRSSQSSGTYWLPTDSVRKNDDAYDDMPPARSSWRGALRSCVSPGWCTQWSTITRLIRSSQALGWCFCRTSRFQIDMKISADRPSFGSNNSMEAGYDTEFIDNEAEKTSRHGGFWDSDTYKTGNKRTWSPCSFPNRRARSCIDLTCTLSR